MVNLVFSPTYWEAPSSIEPPTLVHFLFKWRFVGIQFYYLSQFTAKYLPAGLISFFSFCKHYLQGALHMLQIVDQLYVQWLGWQYKV